MNMRTKAESQAHPQTASQGSVHLILALGSQSQKGDWGSLTSHLS